MCSRRLLSNKASTNEKLAQTDFYYFLLKTTKNEAKNSHQSFNLLPQTRVSIGKCLLEQKSVPGTNVSTLLVEICKQYLSLVFIKFSSDIPSNLHASQSLIVAQTLQIVGHPCDILVISICTRPAFM